MMMMMMMMAIMLINNMISRMTIELIMTFILDSYDDIGMNSINFPHHSPFAAADHTTEDYGIVYGEVFCEYGTFILKTMDRRLMYKDNSGNRRLNLARYVFTFHDQYQSLFVYFVILWAELY